ncbi:hypothetical protein [Paraburkholderia sp. CI3]
MAAVRDLPDAKLHVLYTGHFALEYKLVGPLLLNFLDRKTV